MKVRTFLILLIVIFLVFFTFLDVLMYNKVITDPDFTSIKSLLIAEGIFMSFIIINLCLKWKL